MTIVAGEPPTSWGPQTAQAVVLGPISGRPVPPRQVIRRLASVKASAAVVNGELGVLPRDRALRIERAARLITAGAHLDHFPLDVFQTGSGSRRSVVHEELDPERLTRAKPTTTSPRHRGE